MFEKEAEIYALSNFGFRGKNSQRVLTAKIDFQDGAEFGYNKAKVEVEESYRESLYNTEMNLASVTERLEELEKANEWHYVKGGDLPLEDTKVLALMADKEICIAHFYRRNVWDKIGTIVAWKEIVPPKEIE